MREQRRNNKDKLKEINRKHYLKNASVIISSNKKWAQANPQKVIGYKRKYHQKFPHTIRFKDKRRVLIGDYQRKGICQSCKKTVGNGDIKITHFHHIKYDKTNPLAHTSIVCASCHRKIHANIITLRDFR